MDSPHKHTQVQEVWGCQNAWHLPLSLIQLKAQTIKLVGLQTANCYNQKKSTQNILTIALNYRSYCQRSKCCFHSTLLNMVERRTDQTHKKYALVVGGYDSEWQHKYLHATPRFQESRRREYLFKYHNPLWYSTHLTDQRAFLGVCVCEKKQRATSIQK